MNFLFLDYLAYKNFIYGRKISMIRRCIFITLIFVHSIYAWELACPRGCGGAFDPHLLTAGGKLLKSLQNIEFLEPESTIWGEGETNTYQKMHSYKNETIIWKASHEVAYIEEEDEEMEEETYCFSREQLGDGSPTEFSTYLENYVGTKRLMDYALQDIELFFLDCKRKPEQNIQRYRD